MMSLVEDSVLVLSRTNGSQRGSEVLGTLEQKEPKLFTAVTGLCVSVLSATKPPGHQIFIWNTGGAWTVVLMLLKHQTLLHFGKNNIKTLWSKS